MSDFTDKCTIFDFGRGSTPDPSGGAYSAPSDSLAGGEGAEGPLPKNPALALGPSGLDTLPPAITISPDVGVLE